MYGDPKSYYSLLLCAHPDKVDVFYTGIPLGFIRDSTFHPHEFKQPDGSGRMVTVNDLPHPCPFDSIEQLIQAQIDLLVEVRGTLTGDEG